MAVDPLKVASKVHDALAKLQAANEALKGLGVLLNQIDGLIGQAPLSGQHRKSGKAKRGYEIPIANKIARAGKQSYTRALNAGKPKIAAKKASKAAEKALAAKLK